jgi:hypothetical protein
VISAVLAAYPAIASLFLFSAMSEKPSATDVATLLLWPIAVAILVAWLLILEMSRSTRSSGFRADCSSELKPVRWLAPMIAI